MGINMPNVIDYIEWRGDLTFKESPFNEVDNIILSQIAYVDLSEVVPDVESRLSVTLEKACDTFFQYHDEEELKEVVKETKDVKEVYNDYKEIQLKKQKPNQPICKKYYLLYW